MSDTVADPFLTIFGLGLPGIVIYAALAVFKPAEKEPEMRVMKFHEYMDAKGKIAQPKVSTDGDNLTPATMPDKPPQGGKPYSAKGEKAKKDPKGLGELGDAELKKMPTAQSQYGKPKAPAKIPTVDETAVCFKAVQSISKNPALVETFVRQMKQSGLLGVLVAETLGHRETYSHLSEVMAHASHGPALCGRLVRAMNEEVAKPFSDQLDLDDEGADHIDPADLAGDDLGAMGDDLGPEGEMGDDPLMGPDDEMGDDLGPGGDDPMIDDMHPDMGPEGEMSGDPSMGGPMDPNLMRHNPAMQNFHRAMMKAYMRKMMGKA